MTPLHSLTLFTLTSIISDYYYRIVFTIFLLLQWMICINESLDQNTLHWEQDWSLIMNIHPNIVNQPTLASLTKENGVIGIMMTKIVGIAVIVIMVLEPG